MQDSGLTEILSFICISAIWSQYPVFFLNVRQREWLQPEGCQIAGIVLLPVCPGRLESWMTVTSLFIDIVGNTPFLVFWCTFL